MMIPEIQTEQQGFTLLETLVSFFIVSMFLLAYSEAIRQSAYSVLGSRDISLAVEIAEDLIAEAKAGKFKSGDKKTGSENGLNWDLKMDPGKEISGNNGMKLHEVIIKISSDGRSRVFVWKTNVLLSK